MFCGAHKGHDIPFAVAPNRECHAQRSCQRGQQNWAVDGVAVQGFNIPKISILTFGESFHGNHHAYPSSARLAQAKGELDLGWWLILILQWLGLAWNIKLPAQVGEREGLRALPQLNRRYPKKFALLAAWAAATIIGMCEVVLLNNGAHTRAVPG